MKRHLSAIILFGFFFLFQSVSLLAQNLTGIWKGSFISESGEEYRLEFQISQSNSLVVTGVSYSYLDVRFYGKTTMTGNFNRTNQVLGIQEIKTIELKMDAGSFACIMKYKLTYAKSGREEFLEGSFTSAFEKTSVFVKKGGDCGGGTVYLRKVRTSDFYVEPFLRQKEEPRKDSILIKPRITPPVANKTPAKTNTTVKKAPDKLPGSKNNTTVAKADTTKKLVTPPVIKKSEEKKIVTIPSVLKERENALAQAITVHSKEVNIKLYDNGEIDGDTISIYVDKKLVLSHQGLTVKPIVYTLHFDEDDIEHEVVMVAENLGRIPPNTSLMVINTGGSRYQVQITSTEQKNAMVRFRYEKPKDP